MAFFGEMVSEIWWLGRWCFRKYLASLLDIATYLNDRFNSCDMMSAKLFIEKMI